MAWAFIVTSNNSSLLGDLGVLAVHSRDILKAAAVAHGAKTNEIANSAPSR